MDTNFNIGDSVTWTSQAQGHTKRKKGNVVAVVPVGERPSQRDFPDLYKGPARAGGGRMFPTSSASATSTTGREPRPCNRAPHPPPSP